MTSPTVSKARPLSPHLQVYKPQITSVLSILHRMTGVGLSLALPVFVAWLVALSHGPECYAWLIGYAHTWGGQILLFGWVWAFFYHLCTGIRHLIWDTGAGMDIKQVYRSGYLALLASTLLTAGVWFKLIWCHP